MSERKRKSDDGGCSFRLLLAAEGYLGAEAEQRVPKVRLYLNYYRPLINSAAKRHYSRNTMMELMADDAIELYYTA